MSYGVFGYRATNTMVFRRGILGLKEHIRIEVFHSFIEGDRSFIAPLKGSFRKACTLNKQNDFHIFLLFQLYIP